MWRTYLDPCSKAMILTLFFCSKFPFSPILFFMETSFLYIALLKPSGPYSC